MKETVYWSIQEYHICRQVKSPRNWYNGLLNLLLIPTRPWINIIFNFVAALPSSYNYNAVLIVID